MVQIFVRHGLRVYAPLVAHAAAAVVPGVAVEDLAPAAAARHADAIVVARHRREVAHHQYRRRTVAAHAHERKRALLPVAAVDPAEAFAREVLLMQSTFVSINPVEVRDPALHALVARVVPDHV